MVPDAVFDDGIVTTIDHPIPGKVTKPPLLTWAALKLHETNPDINFLAEVYPALSRLNTWWTSQNGGDGSSLVRYDHPYSSGLDDSPLWDEGMPVVAPDINTYLCVEMRSLAMIAEYLNLDSDAAGWRKKADELVVRMVEQLWDPDAGFFWALKDHKPLKVVTPFNLYPVWAGNLPPEIRDRLLSHLQDPDMFWGRYKIPTVARNDPSYEPDKMWRGPVWVNINYFFIEALRQIGEKDLADRLRDSTLEMITVRGGMAEYYNADTGEVPAPAVSAFGWTAALFIDLAIQDFREKYGSLPSTPP
jgi:glycogen debranching enzyme